MLQLPDPPADGPPPRSQRGSEERVTPVLHHDWLEILRSNLGLGFSGPAPWRVWGMGTAIRRAQHRVQDASVIPND